ncbi:zinc-binding alcohol dehydrogenase family protein [Zavarzinia sp.]|uniref:quinone oxidoreductase family protein n=1 Tax=Zavarzinia sp. TaxID=2027920 RepID=UPI003563C14C
MKAAVVRAKGQPPVFADFEMPATGVGERLVTVTAAALSPLARARAAGTHYSADGGFPFVAGVDGVGRLADGTRAYFILPRAPFGSFAEASVAPAAQCVPVPDGLDDVTAAAIANPGMSSWAALTERARFRKGESVLINGATGASGRLAVQIAKYRGAARVVATGRNLAALDELRALGADATIPLGIGPEALAEAFAAAFADGIDVVLDYLWGSSAELLLAAAVKASPAGRAIRYVEIGAASGAEIRLPGALLRSSGLELTGSGIGSLSLERLAAAVAGVFEAARPAGLSLATRQVPLAEVEAIWPLTDGDRIVLIP